MLLDILPVLKRHPGAYAIGGAIGMGFRGAVRYTEVLDVFVLEEERLDLLAEVHGLGYRIKPTFEPFYYEAWPPWRPYDPEIKIDLLFPAGEPELSGIETATSLQVKKGSRVRVMTPLMLALAKVYSDQPRHIADLGMMLSRGLVAVRDMEATLRDHDPDMLPTLRKQLKLLGPRRPPQRPKGRWSKRRKGTQGP